VDKPVRSAVPGTVVEAGRSGAYGKRIAIRHAPDLVTVCAQLSTIDVAAGQCVGAGDIVGKLGCTGLCAEPHLHFEVLYRGTSVDPASLLPSR
jgi:murein DD-endopeptidase MepM/ murein hydrolase activator NlpD